MGESDDERGRDPAEDEEHPIHRAETRLKTIEYIRQHGLHALFNDILHDVLKEQPADPLVYLSELISNKMGRTSVEEDLAEQKEEVARLRKELLYCKKPACNRELVSEIRLLKEHSSRLESVMMAMQVGQSRGSGDVAQKRLSDAVLPREGRNEPVRADADLMGTSPRHCPSKVNLSVIHFNDVYHCDGFRKEPVGGVARFASSLSMLQTLHPGSHVLFSGDAFSPSITATVTQGAHMVPILNALNVEAACIGNHDLDFGIDRFVDLSEKCTFPWLLTNLMDLGEPLGKAKEYKIFHWKGVKVGILGVVEQEWIDACGQLSNTVQYIDMVHAANKTCQLLIDSGVQIIIALTHMRMHNDRLLAEQCPQIDLILGGHDHDFMHEEVNETTILKSGSDFRYLSHVSISVPGMRLVKGHSELYKVEVKVRKVEVTSEVNEDKKMLQIVESNKRGIEERLGKVVATTEVQLDLRFSHIRTHESAFGNWATDIARWYYHFVDCDVALLQGGCFRADTVFEKGPLTLEDLLKIVPIEDPIIVISLTGNDLIEALNSSVSKYPRHDGRFPQVSGVKFSFKPDMPPGRRIQDVWVLNKLEGDQYDPVECGKVYRVATSAYLAAGNDGYLAFSGKRKIIDAEQGVILPVLLRNYLYLQRWGEAIQNSVNDILRRILRNRPAPTNMHTLTTGIICPYVSGRITIIETDEPGDTTAVEEFDPGL